MRFFKVLLLMAFVIISSPSFSADYQKGVDAYNRGDYQSALREWRPLAEQGEADANSDGKINAGELHAFVRESVRRFSAGAQTPMMLGDAGRWVLQ